MKVLIERGIEFVKKNPTIIYSLLLIFVMIGALFFNSYFILNRFQDNLDKTLRTKAVLAEDIIGIVARENFSDLARNKNLLEEKISQIQKNDPEITDIKIYAPSPINEEYYPLISTPTPSGIDEAATDPTAISQNAIKFSLSVNDAFAYLSNVDGNRNWSVVKAVRNQDGVAEGVLLLKLSLAQSDALVKKTIVQVYLFSLGAMLIVLLLVFNHIRLFTFEIRAKKLEEIDKMKDDFISMASHELKSPLTAIRGYVDLLNDSLEATSNLAENKIEQARYLTNIDISVNRLRVLVEDLLDVSRIEQNRLPIELQEVDLTKIVLEIADEMEILASEKNLEIKKSMAEIPKVSADPERVKQIVVNLLSNAIKYTPSGSIEIQIKKENGNVSLIIADTGLGISAENMKKLFTKFYRVASKETAQISGTGLGLWIAREIAQKMGGDLKVESIEGVGSHFTLVLKEA